MRHSFPTRRSSDLFLATPLSLGRIGSRHGSQAVEPPENLLQFVARSPPCQAPLPPEIPVAALSPLKSLPPPLLPCFPLRTPLSEHLLQVHLPRHTGEELPAATPEPIHPQRHGLVEFLPAPTPQAATARSRSGRPPPSRRSFGSRRSRVLLAPVDSRLHRPVKIPEPSLPAAAPYIPSATASSPSYSPASPQARRQQHRSTPSPASHRRSTLGSVSSSSSATTRAPSPALPPFLSNQGRGRPCLRSLGPATPVDRASDKSCSLMLTRAWAVSHPRPSRAPPASPLYRPVRPNGEKTTAHRPASFGLLRFFPLSMNFLISRELTVLQKSPSSPCI